MEGYNDWVKGRLELQKEPGFQAFTARLLPGAGNILGVRLPRLREMAKQLAEGDWRDYLLSACDDSYEETMLQGLVLGYAKGNLQEKRPYLQSFIPKINNRSVCDSTCSTLRLAIGLLCKCRVPFPYPSCNRGSKGRRLLRQNGAGMGAFHLLPGIPGRNAALFKGKPVG